MKKLANARADDLARTIMSTDDTRQIFGAVRTLTDTKPKSTISVLTLEYLHVCAETPPPDTSPSSAPHPKTSHLSTLIFCHSVRL